jgi:hypothetical protein
MVRRGPEVAQAKEHFHETDARAARPLSAATDAHPSAVKPQGSGHAA